MADFKDASLWTKLSMLFLCLGFFIMHEPFYSGVVSNSGGTVACGVIGFLCYLTALVLILGYVFLDELNGNKPAQICIIVFSLIAGVALIIALAIFGGKHHGVSGAHGTGIVMSGLLAILAGIFEILDLVGIGGGGGGGSK